MLTHATNKKLRIPSGANYPVHSPWHAQHPHVQQILRSPSIQTKLTIGAPNDKYEQEADQVADQMMRMPDSQPSVLDGHSSQVNDKLRSSESVQRACASCAEEESEELIQTKSTNNAITEVTPTMGSEIQSLQGGGQPLSGMDRNYFEPRFGADFSNVRVHNDAHAANVARSINARAFTLGQDVVFGSGEYSSGTSSGRELLAHELTHVLQQQSATQSTLSRSVIQRRIGDGHDLQSPRFSGDTTLEDIYDGTGTLKDGDENESVRKVQHAIHDYGLRFGVHGPDGKFGPETKRRVRRFQRRRRITTDPRGEVGAATIESLDQLFPAMALPAAATSAYTFPCMLQILCQWNSAMIRDLRNFTVIMVADLQWADERFDGTSWQPNPMDGAGETSGSTIYIATDDTSEAVARSLYHEYQHGRSPLVNRRADWSTEENYAFRLETDWAVARGITPDPSVTRTDPATGQTVTDTSGIATVVQSYPGLDVANPGEVIAKLSGNRVRVRMPNGRIRVRNAVKGDSIPGRRVTTAPRRRVRAREWRC